MNTYGTPAKPFPELPPAASFYSVGWAGVKGVIWDTTGVSYLHRSLTNPTADSSAGTLSLWIRFKVHSVAEIIQFGPYFTLFVAPSIGGVGINQSESGDASVYLSTKGRDVIVGETPGDPPTPISAQPGLAYEDDGNPGITDINKWHHVYVAWDTDAGVGKIAVDGVNRTTLIVESGTEEEGVYGAPFSVPWSLSVPGDDFFDTNILPFNIYSPPFGSQFSIAELWIDTTRYDVGKEKFINAATGSSPGLGDTGEIPMGTAPTFFFRRRGDAVTFIENKGIGGTFVLSGSEPTAEPIAVKVGR